MTNTAASPVHRPVPHRWVAPPPGTGTIKVCAKCGERKLAGADDKPCVGKPEPVYPTANEYDPIGD
jgi:hypothetical protein